MKGERRMLKSADGVCKEISLLLKEYLWQSVTNQEWRGQIMKIDLGTFGWLKFSYFVLCKFLSNI